MTKANSLISCSHYHKPTNIHETIFQNGLKLLVHARHVLPIVTVMICYRVGASDLYLGKTGLAHFVEHMLFKGTNVLAKGEIDAITQNLGGTNNAYTTHDFTCYYFNFAKEHWERALEIEADRMTNCIWSEAEFNREKDVIIEELTSNLDTTSLFLMQEASALFYRTHPYRHPITGWKQDIQNLTLHELYDYYHSYYLPNNAFVTIVGDVNPDEVKIRVGEIFQHIKPGKLPPHGQRNINFPTSYRQIEIFHNVHIPQFAILFPTCASTLSTIREEIALDILDITLATGKSSHLHRSLVEKERLLQYITASNNVLHDPAIFWIQGELLPGASLEKVELGILNELDQLLQTPLSDDELQRAKNMFASGIIGCQATVYDTAEDIVESEITGGYKKISKVKQILELTTSKMVLSAARRYLNPKWATIVRLMPKKSAKIYLSDGHIGKSIQNADKISAKFVDQFGQSEKLLENKLSSDSIQTDQIVFWQEPINDIPWTSYGINLHARKFDFDIRDTYQRAQAFYPECITLPNGLTLIVFNNPTISEVLIRLCFRKVMSPDPMGREGASHLLGEMLEKGTTLHTAQQINDIIEFTGSGFSVTRNEINMKVFEHDLELALSLVAEVAQFPKLDEQDLAIVKRKHIAELITLQDDTEYQATLAFKKQVYHKHPFARPLAGTFDSISKIHCEDLEKIHRQYFTPARAVLVIVGRLDNDKTMALVHKFFGGWYGLPYFEEVFPTLTLSTMPIVKEIPLNKEQLSICYGHLGVRRSNPDFHKLIALDAILGTGEGFTDRLSKKIRDELGLCYYISASVTSNAGHEPGTFCATLATSPEHYKLAMAILEEEIIKLQNQKVTHQELARVKNYLINKLIALLETNESLVGYYLTCYSYQLGFDYLKNLPQIWESLTADHIQEMAQKYLHPCVAITTVAGPIPH